MGAGPKALPTQIRVGIDVANVQRFRKLIHPTRRLERWAKHVFNPLEQRHWKTKLAQYLGGDKNELAEIRLARFMAGRWALKEAAVKAHSQRRILLRDIIIIGKGASEASEFAIENPDPKPRVLIDPPRQVVLFDESTAKKRGLADKVKRVSHVVEGHNGRRGAYNRWAKVQIDERQMADGSISHDGDYVVAICQALDVPVEEGAETPIRDDGSGEPIHEPEPGDQVLV